VFLAEEVMHTTKLYDYYKDLSGIKMTDFGGWDLPVNYEKGITGEHNAVRNSAGMFDVSHMGECMVTGPGAQDFLNGLLTNDLESLCNGKAMYTLMLYENGTVVDDLIVYKISEEQFFVVLNASNVEKDLKWINGHCPDAVKVEDMCENTVQIAVQGPDAVKYIEKIKPEAVSLGFFEFIYKDDVFIGRTGYTGEDGFEIYCPVEKGGKYWKQLIKEGITPCGLGARDTLRLEAKLPLYGHEIDNTITPLEANLKAFVKLDKKDFIGKKVLDDQMEQGIPRSLRGFEMVNGGVPRNGYAIFYNGDKIGYVTSGAKSPTINEFIGLGMMKRNTGLKFGDEIDIEIHKKMKKAVLVRTPFYKHGKRGDGK